MKVELAANLERLRGEYRLTLDFRNETRQILVEDARSRTGQLQWLVEFFARRGSQLSGGPPN
jgi:hypothetical protein